MFLDWFWDRNRSRRFAFFDGSFDDGDEEFSSELGNEVVNKIIDNEIQVFLVDLEGHETHLAACVLLLVSVGVGVEAIRPSLRLHKHLDRLVCLCPTKKRRMRGKIKER